MVARGFPMHTGSTYIKTTIINNNGHCCHRHYGGGLPMLGTFGAGLLGGIGLFGGGFPMFGGGFPMFGGGFPMFGGGFPMLGGGFPMLGGGFPMLGGGFPTLGGAQNPYGYLNNNQLTSNNNYSTIDNLRTYYNEFTWIQDGDTYYGHNGEIEVSGKTFEEIKKDINAKKTGKKETTEVSPKEKMQIELNELIKQNVNLDLSGLDGADVKVVTDKDGNLTYQLTWKVNGKIEHNYYLTLEELSDAIIDIKGSADKKKPEKVVEPELKPDPKPENKKGKVEHFDGNKTYTMTGQDTWYGVIQGKYDISGLSPSDIKQFAYKLAAANSGIENEDEAFRHASTKGIAHKTGQNIELPDELEINGKKISLRSDWESAATVKTNYSQKHYTTFVKTVERTPGGWKATNKDGEVKTFAEDKKSEAYKFADIEE